VGHPCGTIANVGQREWDKDKERARKAEYRKRKKAQAAENRGGGEPVANEPGVVEAFAERGGAAVPPSTAPEQPPAANEPLPEQVVVSRMYGKRDDEPYTHVPDEDLTPLMEQEIRDFWGYGPSDKRTRAQRKAAADAIIAKNRDQIAWAHEVWARQAETMPQGTAPDMAGKPLLEKALKEQAKKAKNPWDG
jgi:hypothetical protein